MSARASDRAGRASVAGWSPLRRLAGPELPMGDESAVIERLLPVSDPQSQASLFPVATDRVKGELRHFARKNPTKLHYDRLQLLIT